MQPNMSLFTNDAMSMYTNVDTDAFIEIISKYLRNNASCFGYDIEALIGAIVIASATTSATWETSSNVR